MGALGGAAGGAATGSVAGPIGAAAGGLFGGLWGAFSDDDEPAPAAAPKPAAPKPVSSGGAAAPNPVSGGGVQKMGTGPGLSGFAVEPLSQRTEYYGNYGLGAQDMSSYGISGMKGNQNAAGRAFESMMTGYDQANPMFAEENQQLSDQEAYSRNYDQAGAMQLMREGAMGNAPSEAQYMMQRGLDQSLAGQQAQMGGARGAAGLALAGSNAMANSAAMQNQAYNQGSQLRAKEMQDYTNAYGTLATQMRGQDQNRLNIGNEMNVQNAKFGNDMATNNMQQANQYRLGVGNVGAQYGNTGLGYYGSAQKPLESDMTGRIQQRGQDADAWLKGAQINQSSFDTTNSTRAGMDAAAMKRDTDELNAWLGFSGAVVNGAAKMAAGA